MVYYAFYLVNKLFFLSYGSTMDLQWLCMRFGLNWIDHVLVWCCYGFIGFCPGFATGLTIEVLKCEKHFTSMMHTRTMRTIPRDTKYLSQQFSKTIDHRRPLSWSNSWNMSFRMRCSEKSISDHQIANVHIYRITEYLYHAIVSCISRSRIKRLIAYMYIYRFTHIYFVSAGQR